MKTISPYRTGVTSFSSSLTQAQHQQQQGFEYDSGDYILSLASPPPSSAQTSPIVAAALSNQSIILYDTNTGQVTHRIEKAHDGPISQIAFFPWEYQGITGTSTSTTSLPLLISASHDGTIKVWDAISNQQQPAITMKLALPNEQALSVSVGYGGTLVAVGTNKARISFFDLRYSQGNLPSGVLMGSYVDAHTDEVTQVTFQTIQSPSQPSESKTVLATASEDGLVAIHDPSQPSEEDALLSVLNIGAPLRNVGFFGPCLEGMYALTGSETMSVHHWDSAQTVSHVGGGGLRGLLSDAVAAHSGMNDNAQIINAIDYLVGCAWATVSTEAASPALHLVAGNSKGDGYLFRMDADQITPVIHLKGGHRGCIRDFCWIDSSSGGKRLITGGEDARLCEWDLSGTTAVAGGSFGTGKNAKSHNGGGPMSGRKSASGGSSGGGVAKGKKKFGSPY